MKVLFKVVVIVASFLVALLVGAILAGLNLYPFDRVVNILQTSPTTVSTRNGASKVDTAFHTLQTTRHEVTVAIGGRASGGTPGRLDWGGGITALGEEIVGTTSQGRFFLIQNPTGDAVVSRLDISTDHNRDSFIAYMAEKGLSEFDARRWFRHIDLLHLQEGDSESLLLSHHYWHPEEECYSIRLSKLSIGRGESLLALSKGANEWDTVFESTPCLEIESNYYGLVDGGRMVESDDGSIYLSVGEFGFNSPRDVMHSQSLSSDYGKIIKIDLQTGGSEIVAIGIRNPQGLALDGEGNLWATEHGPKGGDELNLIRAERNYGWPHVTYGTAYGGKIWPLSKSQGRHSGFERPIFAWTPSIGVSNLIFVDGFSPEWDGDILVTTLKRQTIFRMRYEDNRIVLSEPIFLGSRIRDIVQMPDGNIVLWDDAGSITSIGISDPDANELAEWMPSGLDEDQAELVANTVLTCVGCHSVQAGAPEVAAPNLWNVYNRRIAGSKYFSGYSTALESRSGIWDDESLDDFLRNSEAFAPGNGMEYPPIADAQVRDAVISYLRSLRPNDEQDAQPADWQVRLQRLTDTVTKKIFGD